MPGCYTIASYNDVPVKRKMPVLVRPSKAADTANGKVCRIMVRPLAGCAVRLSMVKQAAEITNRLTEAGYPPSANNSRSVPQSVKITG